MKHHKILIYLALLLYSPVSQPDCLAQDKELKVDVYKILSSWTYKDVEQYYGEGENIIDSMAGQAYISGFRYQDNWFDRPCTLEFYFTDINVSRFLLRFTHPNNLKLEAEDKKRQETSQTGTRSSNVIPDSVWAKRIKDNPGILDSLGKAFVDGFVYRKSLFEKDSLRADSIIRDLQDILGIPLKEGPTPHTDKDSRYFATWIKNGFSCSVKDYRKYAEVNFGVSPAPGAVLSGFNLDPKTKVIEKINLKVKNKNIEISILGVPLQRGSSVFTEINLLAVAGPGTLYLDELPEERQIGMNPKLKVLDLTGDGLEDIWLQSEIPDGTGCTNNLIYTMELIEPLLIFDPIDELKLDLDGDFQDNYQAMVLLDGYTRTYLPLDKNKAEYQDIYDENGKLLKPVMISVGSVKRLEAKPSDTNKGSQFYAYLPITGVSSSDILGYIQAIWDYNQGGWELKSVEIWQE